MQRGYARCGDTAILQVQDESQNLMWAEMRQLNLSSRAYHRILKLARTIADLTEREDIQSRSIRADGSGIFTGRHIKFDIANFQNRRGKD